MKLGSKIKKIRELKNYSQQFMANQLNQSQAYYSKIENNNTKITDEMLHEISKILGVEKDIIEAFNDAMIFNRCNQSGYIETINNYSVDKKLDELISIFQKQTEEIIKLKQEIEKIKGK